MCQKEAQKQRPLSKKHARECLFRVRGTRISKPQADVGTWGGRFSFTLLNKTPFRIRRGHPDPGHHWA